MSSEFNMFRRSALEEAKNSKKWLEEALAAAPDSKERDRKQDMGQHATQMSALWMLCAEVNHASAVLELILEHLKEETVKSQEQNTKRAGET
jgi:hypothetical protein